MDNACFPPGREVGFGPVLEIAHVMQRDFIVANFRPSLACNIGLPWPISRWLDGEPPRQHGAKANHHQTCRAPEAPDENEGCEHCHAVDEGEWHTEPWNWQVKVKRAGRPERCNAQHEVERKSEQ